MTNLRKSPAGKHLKKIVLTGSLQEKFEVASLALQIFDDRDIRESYKNDLLDPNLDNKSVMVDSISKPWRDFRPSLIRRYNYYYGTREMGKLSTTTILMLRHKLNTFRRRRIYWLT